VSDLLNVLLDLTHLQLNQHTHKHKKVKENIHFLAQHHP